MKSIVDFTVKSNKELNSSTILLIVESKEELPRILPGQFVNVKIDNNSVLLRRPISIHDVDYKNRQISLYIKVLGKGTASLKELEVGDIVNILLPLGNSFDISLGKKPLLIGGGCGVAPLLYLAKVLFEDHNIKPTVLIGARSEEDILQVNEYKKYADLLISTEDGSLGEKGYPTNHTVWDNPEFDCIYCCGPEIMMKAIAVKSKEMNIPCEVSLENTMACGIGACLCCVQDTDKGHQCVCTDGPVFNINVLKW
ncbi:dihydroorotate dehydrogenase electron transfer subunit [Marinilabiliaceae bacterium JC040]|nr:dihydroorotate dehydrogenase electron transfer subunit [Marinilabiliaceae bacterium JC040]